MSSFVKNPGLPPLKTGQEMVERGDPETDLTSGQLYWAFCDAGVHKGPLGGCEMALLERHLNTLLPAVKSGECDAETYAFTLAEMMQGHHYVKPEEVLDRAVARFRGDISQDDEYVPPQKLASPTVGAAGEGSRGPKVLGRW